MHDATTMREVAGVTAAAAAGRRYVLVFLGALGAALALVVGLNLLLGTRAEGSPGAVTSAAAWQRATRGVTYPPPITANRPFKILRLIDRLPELNGIVFGASSSMGMTADAFPGEITVYNFAQTANPLHATIPEAEYALAHFGGRVKWYFIAIDWAVGMPSQPGTPGAIALTREAALAAAARPPESLAGRLREALSWPRVRNLGVLAADALRSGDPLRALRDAFFAESSADYRCPDGTPARDYDTINRGICAGFRYDGSATFADGKPVEAARGRELARAGAALSSRYSRALAPHGGEPNPALLARLAALANRARASGARVILFMPPLIPGLERELAASAHAGPAVRRVKSAFAGWAAAAGIVVIDAGASERYGCASGEFLDEHHAYPPCYRKVLEAFWRAWAAGTVRPGLWRPGDS